MKVKTETFLSPEKVRYNFAFGSRAEIKKSIHCTSKAKTDG